MATKPDRLHALDLAWLEMEGTGPSIAIGTVAVADGPAPDTAEVLALLADRLPRMPRLHEEPAAEVGVGLRRPAWVPAEQLDLAAHVHRVRPPRDRDRRGRPTPAALDASVAAIMEHRLPVDRPLWDVWVVEGLPDGRWALVWRVHHSIADGVGSVMLLGHAFDTAPDGGRTLADVVRAGGASDPHDASARAIGNPSDGQHHPPGAALGHVVGAVRSTAPHLPVALAALVPHAPSELTGPVGDGRVWVSGEVPLAQVKAVRRAFGVTVNDVVLACVTGGFRDLLGHRGAPGRGQVVRNLVPVSLRPRGDAGTGNQVSALLGHLPVGLDDPVERLRAVASGVDHGQHAREPALAALLLGIVDHLVPAAVQDVAVATAGRTLPAWFFDTLTTNVPGPQFPLHVAGRRVRAMFPIIPVAGHTCITTGIFSYDGALDIGVSGDADRAGDIDVLAHGIRRAADELAACAG